MGDLVAAVEFVSRAECGTPRGDRHVALVLHEARDVAPYLEAPKRCVLWLAWDEPYLLLDRWSYVDNGGHIKRVPVASRVSFSADVADGRRRVLVANTTAHMVCARGRFYIIRPRGAQDP